MARPATASRIKNSFVINAFGEPLANLVGLPRVVWRSPHHDGWTRTTAAKNAILIDGKGQAIKTAGATGSITRFVNSTRFSFVSGDAGPAYVGHATQALRHVFFVDRRYFVMLDEVAAPEDSNFPMAAARAGYKMTLDAAKQ